MGRYENRTGVVKTCLLCVFIFSHVEIQHNLYTHTLYSYTTKRRGLLFRDRVSKQYQRQRMPFLLAAANKSGVEMALLEKSQQKCGWNT